MFEGAKSGPGGFSGSTAKKSSEFRFGSPRVTGPSSEQTSQDRLSGMAIGNYNRNRGGSRPQGGSGRVPTPSISGGSPYPTGYEGGTGLPPGASGPIYPQPEPVETDRTQRPVSRQPYTQPISDPSPQTQSMYSGASQAVPMDQRSLMARAQSMYANRQPRGLY